MREDKNLLKEKPSGWILKYVESFPVVKERWNLFGISFNNYFLISLKVFEASVYNF